MAVTAQMVKELRELTGAGMLDCKKALVENDGNIDEAVKTLREKGLAKAAKKAGRIAAEGIATFKLSDDAKKGVILEVNSETDFVAKNDDFIQFVDTLADVLLAGDYASLNELKAAKFDGGDMTVEEKLNNLIAKIGENMSIRRFDYMVSESGFVNGYVHGNGKMAVILGLETDGSRADFEAMSKDIAMQIAAMNPKFVSDRDVDQAYLENEREILIEQAKNEGKPMEIVQKMVEGRLKKSLKEICLLDQPFVKDTDLTVGQLIDNTAKQKGQQAAISSFIRYEVGEGIEKSEEDFAAEVAATIANK